MECTMLDPSLSVFLPEPSGSVTSPWDSGLALFDSKRDISFFDWLERSKALCLIGLFEGGRLPFPHVMSSSDSRQFSYSCDYWKGRFTLCRTCDPFGSFTLDYSGFLRSLVDAFGLASGRDWFHKDGSTGAIGSCRDLLRIPVGPVSDKPIGKYGRDTFSAVTVHLGVTRNGVFDDSQVIVEFNPNKVLLFPYGLYVLKVLAESLQLQRCMVFDLAIDMPYPRSAVLVPKVPNALYQYYSDRGGSTTYLRENSKSGRVKVYDKTNEANNVSYVPFGLPGLDAPVTRVELTCDGSKWSAEDCFKKLPLSCLMPSDARSERLKCVPLIFALNANGDSSWLDWLCGSDRDFRKKVLAALRDLSLVFDADSVAAVRDFAVSACGGLFV